MREQSWPSFIRVSFSAEVKGGLTALLAGWAAAVGASRYEESMEQVTDSARSVRQHQNIVNFQIRVAEN